MLSHAAKIILTEQNNEQRIRTCRQQLDARSRDGDSRLLHGVCASLNTLKRAEGKDQMGHRVSERVLS